jgi:hypothetical protein
MITAIVSSIIAWFIGLLIDANIGFEPVGFLELRILFPMLTMGGFILSKMKIKK